MLATIELDREWSAALADAGLDRTATRLYVVDGGQATTDAGAVWFRPGDELHVDVQFPNPSHVADANLVAHRGLHRIVVWRDAELPIVAGRLRHELEHARQWDQLGADFFELNELAIEVLRHKAGALEGCAGMYLNATPTELDCNAAAAMFLCNRHPESVDGLRQDNATRVLACSLGRVHVRISRPLRGRGARQGVALRPGPRWRLRRR
jgi:hypothetical protein